MLRRIFAGHCERVAVILPHSKRLQPARLLSIQEKSAKFQIVALCCFLHCLVPCQALRHLVQRAAMHSWGAWGVAFELLSLTHVALTPPPWPAISTLLQAPNAPLESSKVAVKPALRLIKFAAAANSFLPVSDRTGTGGLVILPAVLPAAVDYRFADSKSTAGPARYDYFFRLQRFTDELKGGAAHSSHTRRFLAAAFGICCVRVTCRLAVFYVEV